MTNDSTDRSPNLIRLSGDFERDVLPFRSQLYRYALSRTKNAADAEDLLQDTMLSAFKGYGSLRPDSHLKSWLMTIMRNIWIDGHRVASRRPVETTLDDTVDSQTTSAALATRDQRSAETRLLDADFDGDVVDAMSSCRSRCAGPSFWLPSWGWTAGTRPGCWVSRRAPC